jgi:hypothetical protein
MKDKEQTPIEIVESLKGKNEIEQAVIILSYTKAKVLEALEREVPKACNEFTDTRIPVHACIEYYETEVKPRYERDVFKT